MLELLLEVWVGDSISDQFSKKKKRKGGAESFAFAAGSRVKRQEETWQNLAKMRKPVCKTA
jgi:hypothetical protein